VITALERPVVEAVIRDAVGLGFRRIQFTGGDPLLCRFLPELVAYVRELKGPAVEIYTNGLALVPSLLNQLAPLTPSFAFSFYSADPTVHDAITGVSGSQQRTLAAIDRCLSAGLEVRAAVIAMPSNQASLAETIELLTVNGVRRVSWSGTSEVGRGEYFERPGELGDSDAGHRALPSGPSSDTEPVASPQFVESLVRGTLCVSSNGDVLPCIFNRRTILGNVRERGLMGIARGPRVRHQLAMAAERSLACSGCRLTDFAIRQSAGGA
jgi:MoaA/NifB/PqqE/SkfB family radical SAM enzyme